jgi:hypothetical protein
MLQDRIQNPNAVSETAIPIHVFTAAFSLWVRGHIAGSVLVSAFNLDATETTQANSLKAAYDAGTAIEKMSFLHNFETAGIMFEQGLISQAEYVTIMGL